MSSTTGTVRVPVEHECFIPVARHHVLSSLLERIENDQDRDAFRDLARMVEAIYHFEYHATASSGLGSLRARKEPGSSPS